jgi:lipopolysaccharide/colanic/teichoic acid biosynthesis glycosyltransferase
MNADGRAAGAASTRAWPARARLGDAVVRLLDVLLAALLLVLFAALVVVLAVAIKFESRGPALYRSRRVGVRGREFEMLKFRKMREGVDGSRLTAPEDDRFTRLGRFLAQTKLDELPQLWNVLKGQMSLVGPRPEDPVFVARFREELEPVLGVRPGITGLSQLAFARESEILDPVDREVHYVERILPQKIQLDTMFATQRSARTYVRILAWTSVAVILRRDVAVHRLTGAMRLRRRPQLEPAGPALSSLELSPVPVEQPGP